MKTEIKISAIAYDLELVDLRTHEFSRDRIVLDRSWLDVLNKVDMSDYDFIVMTYNKRGYWVKQMLTRKKVSLSVDLEELYNNQLREAITDREFINQADTRSDNLEVAACDAK